MAEIINEQEERELARKVRAKKRIRGFLIIVNGLLACYLLFLVGDVIVDFYNYQIKGDENNFVTLCNKNRSNSQKLYKQYLEKSIDGKISEIGDLTIYGQYLHLSEEAFDLPTYRSIKDIQLINVCSKTPAILASLHYNTLSAPIKKLNEGMNLTKLDVGDYLIFQNYVSASNYGSLIKVASGSENAKYVLYSLPDKENKRKMITVYAYPQNEAMVIKVKNISRLPANYYDFVIFGKESFKNEVAELMLKYDVKFFDDKVNLKTLHEVNATYAINLLENNEEKVITSSYLNNSFAKDTRLVDAGKLTDYDANKYIRELGGYTMRAGARQMIMDNGNYMRFDDSYEIANMIGNHDIGKQTYLLQVNESHDHLPSLFEQIINDIK